MKKFNFELAQVLEFRDFEKKQAEAELSKALAVENQINNQLMSIAQRFAELNQMMKGSVNFADVIAQSQHTKLLEYQKEELLKQLAEAKLVSDEKRKILVECMKKTTALEKLKEVQFEEYKAEVAAAEKKQSEELASIKSFSENVK